MDFICLPIIFFTGLLLISILTSLFSVRLGIPLILLFIVIGIIVGSQQASLLFTGLLTLQNVFFINSVALALILFESGFTTPMESFKHNAKPALILASGGVIFSVLFLTPLAYFILPITFIQSLLLSSIIGSTDAAAVFFLLRSRGLYLKNKIQSTLEIESGANDPMAIFLTFLCITLLQKSTAIFDQQTVLLIGGYFLMQVLIGGIGGYLLFLGLKNAINKLHLEQALYPLFVLAVVMMGFAMITLIGGSGYLALYLCGLLLGNSAIKAHLTLAKFQQTIAWLCQILMFTVLGIFVHYEQLYSVLSVSLIIGTGLIFFARPLMVFIILSFFKYSFAEKLFISFVGLRGATSVLLALTPILYGFSFGLTFFNIVFIMVLLSLSVQGLLIPFMAKKCRVTQHLNGTPPEKTEIDLPDLIHSSLIMYEVNQDSPVLCGQNLPKWAQPLLLKRNQLVFQSNNMPTLQNGDKVFVFAPTEHRSFLLDKLYGNTPATDKCRIWGDFPIEPNTKLSDLKFLYGIEPTISVSDMTVAEFIQTTFPEADIGDRISFGPAELIIRNCKNNHITKLGIDIMPNAQTKSFILKHQQKDNTVTQYHDVIIPTKNTD